MSRVAYPETFTFFFFRDDAEKSADDIRMSSLIIYEPEAPGHGECERERFMTFSTLTLLASIAVFCLSVTVSASVIELGKSKAISDHAYFARESGGEVL